MEENKPIDSAISPQKKSKDSFFKKLQVGKRTSYFLGGTLLAATITLPSYMVYDALDDFSSRNTEAKSAYAEKYKEFADSSRDKILAFEPLKKSDLEKIADQLNGLSQYGENYHKINTKISALQIGTINKIYDEENKKHAEYAKSRVMNLRDEVISFSSDVKESYNHPWANFIFGVLSLSGLLLGTSLGVYTLLNSFTNESVKK